MAQISRLVWDQALAQEVAVCDAQLWLARLTLTRLGNVLLLGQVDVAAAHLGVFNDALARANQAVDTVKAALVGSTSPRAVELTAEIPLLESWIDDALAQSVPFNAAVEGGDASGALALIPDLHAALADAETAVTRLAGVVDSPEISGLRQEDAALLGTVDDPLPPSVVVVRRVAGPPVYAVPVREQLRTRVRSDAELARNAALRTKLAEARRDTLTRAAAGRPARGLVGLRLAG